MKSSAKKTIDNNAEEDDHDVAKNDSENVKVPECPENNDYI